jgi:H+-transporting ATPase
MTPLGWSWAGFVWGYALLWFLVNDRLKLLAYRIFDPAKTVSKPEVKAEPQPDGKAVPEVNNEPQPQPEDTAEPKPDTKEESQPVAKAEPEPEVKTEAITDTKSETMPETKAEPEAKVEPTPEAKTKTPSDLTPGMIKRVHELYEELGRKDLQAVEELEKSERENRKDDK